MGVIGVSLAIASVLALLIMYPQSWRRLAQPFWQWTGQAASDKSAGDVDGDRLAMPASETETETKTETENAEDDDDEATTPKAVPTTVVTGVPTFSLSEPGSGDDNDDDNNDDDDNMPPPMFPSPFSAQRAGASADPDRGAMRPPPAPSPRVGGGGGSGGMMLPPPLPTAASRRAPALPIPNRGGPPRSSRPPSASLAPPPNTTVQPTRPAQNKTGSGSRNKVMLAPGHSPLDWARLTADPVGNNLRGSGVPADAPYLLRITPAQLKQMNGRKGRDAWTALGGMVYNISPYVPFHPGGAGELLRCAGKDGSKLFHEVHSWVNYENMLAACRVGILVDDGAPTTSPMEEMD